MVHAPRCPIRAIRVLLIAAFLSAIAFPFSTCNADNTVTAVAAGSGHTLFIESDGSLWGMGDNSAGELGLGLAITQTNLPQQILNTNVTPAITAVAAGAGGHSLFLESNGSLWGMGYNYYGQLGSGNTNNSFFPELIVSSGVTRVAVGEEHSLFTTVTGSGLLIMTLWAMGDNLYGGLGDGSTTERNTPEQIQTFGLLNAVTALAGGGEHSLYVKGDGSLWATGYNIDGQLGDGAYTNHHSYEEIVPNNVSAIAAGGSHSLFIKSDGSLWAMGDDEFGQLGDNSTVGHDSPEQVGVNVTAIAAGLFHSLFIKSDGSLWAMGYNGYGQLGDGTTTDRHFPVLIVSSNVVAVSTSWTTSFFIKSDGSLWAMGYNFSGQIGDGTYTDRHSPVQVVPLVIPQPAITNISLAKPNLVLSGTNAQSGRTYYTLMSTNLTQPFSQWTRVATNFASTDGVFSIIATNAVVPNAARRFFVLQVR